MKRFTVLPVTLYRFQSGNTPKLREYEAQKKRGLLSYDFILGQNKLYNPFDGDEYKRPNGFSLRPIGMNLAQLVLNQFNFKVIYELPEKLQLPDPFVVILEHGDHYSLQTKVPIEPEKFHEQAKKLFEKQKKIPRKEMQQILSNLIKKEL